MPRQRVVRFLNDRWAGNKLSAQTADKIESVYRKYEENGYYSDLKSTIKDVPDNLIDQSIKYQEDVVDPPSGELTDNQTLSVAFGTLSRSCVFGDSVGLGKSPEISGVINNIEHIDNADYSVLVVCENETTAKPMQRKMIQFTGKYYGYSDGVAKNVQPLIDSYIETGFVENLVVTVSIFKQPLFQQYVQYVKYLTGSNPYDIIVIDESHTVSHSNSQTYKAAVDLFGDVSMKFCLNATEFDTSLQEFYDQLNFCDPTFLPTKTKFTKDYCILVPNRFARGTKLSGKYKNTEDFKHKIGYRYWADTRIHRGGHVFNSSAEIIKVPTNSYQQSLLKRTTMPKIIINAPWTVDEHAAMTEDFCPKLGVLKDTISNILEESPKATILLYANLIESQNGVSHVLDNMGISHSIMNGATSPSDREDSIRKAKFSNDAYVLITNVGRSLDFEVVNYAIFYEFPTLATAIQFEGRMTRDLNIKDKHVKVLLAPKEYTKFKSQSHDRSVALDKLTNVDNSLILEMLLNNVDKVEH